MENLKQVVANAILGLPDTANFSDIQAVLETFQQELETVAELSRVGNSLIVAHHFADLI